jgi:L-amino acid N-acyltransferase YncA
MSTRIPSTVIRPAAARDAAAIAAIYNHYILNTTISFEEQAVSTEEMAGRIAKVSAALPWLVYERDGQLLGYAYASPWRARSAYRHSVETSAYVDHRYGGQKIGSQLYEALLADLRERGLRVVIGGIAQPNPASVALHEHFGFKKVAHFSQVGKKAGQWLDVGYWELLINQ